MTQALNKLLLTLRHYGIRITIAKVWKKLTGRELLKTTRYKYRPLPESTLKMQRKIAFPREIKFGILTPLYNTAEHHLRDMLESVTAQTYSNWELCLADASGPQYGYVEEICRSYAAQDNRIKYKRLESNLGIAANTNACITMTDAEYISFLDHDDMLTPDALFETISVIYEHEALFIYSDEDKVNADTTKYYGAVFKPDFAPDTLRGSNYICHFVTVSRQVLDRTGMLKPQYDGAQDYDLVLRITEELRQDPAIIRHIPKVLYHWRVHEQSSTAGFDVKPYAVDAGKRALEAHLERVQRSGSVSQLSYPGTYRIHYDIAGTPPVTILIANKDHIEDLNKCITSIRAKTTYCNYEIIVIENGSTSDETFAFYRQLEALKPLGQGTQPAGTGRRAFVSAAIDAVMNTPRECGRVTVVNYLNPQESSDVFNFSKINNFGVTHAGGEYLIFLNNDTEIITGNWIEEMLMYAQREDVGIVGAKLLYPNDKVQHAGIVLGLGHPVSHAFYRQYGIDEPGYMYRLMTVQNYSAVTAACMMIRKDLFTAADGFAQQLAVEYNDIDLCLKIREKNLLVVWTPFSELYHNEMSSRKNNKAVRKTARESGEQAEFEKKWKHILKAADPYYNENLNKIDAYAI